MVWLYIILMPQKRIHLEVIWVHWSLGNFICSNNVIFFIVFQNSIKLPSVLIFRFLWESSVIQFKYWFRVCLILIYVALAGVAQLVGESSCTLKGCWFDSRSGYIPKLQVQGMHGRQLINVSHIDGFFSLSLSLSPSPSPLRKKFEVYMTKIRLSNIIPFMCKLPTCWFRLIS